MSDDDRADPTPRRFRRLRFNPLRDLLPWVAVAVGLFMTIRGLVSLADGGGPLYVWLGLGLMAAGLIVFFINRGQSRRGS